MRTVRCQCFICKQKGHLAKCCPDGKKKPARRVDLEESVTSTSESGNEHNPRPIKVEEPDPWLLIVKAGGRGNAEAANTRGPTYKVNLVVEEVKVRGS